MTDLQHKEDFDWNQSYSGDASDYTEPDADLLEAIAALEPGEALDVGCGAGGLVVALAQRGWRVTGIDLAEKAVEAARSVAQERGVTAELHVADATSWRPSSQYQLVTNSFALPVDRSDRSSVYRMIRNALAPGGVVLIKDFDSTMNRVEFFADMDLVTVEELTDAFHGYNVIRAEVVPTPAHDHGTESHDHHWTAVLFHAQRH